VIDPNPEVTVSLKRVLAAMPTMWPVLVLLTFGVRAAFGGAPILASEYVAWLFMAGAPAIIALMIVRSMPSPTVAQVLYDAEQSDTAVAAVRERLRGFTADERDRS
jgi:hypothetical protein